MERDSIRIVPRELMHSMETQAKVNVPLWFLDQISAAETISEAQAVLDKMRDSEEEELVKMKSIHLGKVRLRVIDFQSNSKRAKREKKKSL